jgi:hypothetical protein
LVLAARKSVVVALALAAFVVGASSAYAGGGNSSGAKQCQKNGWQNAQTDSGVTFADESACTSYRAQGGVLFSPTLVPNPMYCLVFNGSLIAFYGFTASGFHADSVVTFQLPPSPYPLTTAATDATGVATFPGALVVDPYVLATLNATDAQGVHASIGFTPVCPSF